FLAASPPTRNLPDLSSSCENLPSELSEEPRVVFEHETNVGDVVAEHGNSLDADAERKTRVTLGIDAGVLEDDRVDHPATEDFDPTGVLAEAATVACAIGLDAEHAANVDFGARLDERKVARTKTHRRFRAVEPLGKRRQHPLQLCEAHLFVDEKTLA